MSLATALRECGGANYETFERHTWCQRSSNQPVIGVGRPPALWALSRRAAACCGTITSPNGTGRERCLGSWVLDVHCAHGASVARLSLILAWCCASLLLAVLFHLNHGAYAAPCRGQAPVQVPLNRRCTELQQRGRL